MTKILIVVDMQKDFVAGALGTPEAVAMVDRAVRKIKTFDGDVYATYDTHTEDYSNTAEGKKLPVPHCIRGTDGWQLYPAVQEALDQRDYGTVEKVTFGSVDLPAILEQNYDTDRISVELIGLCTDICVVSNALLLKAHFPEMPIAVDASCCAGVTPETHRAALTTMKMCQIDVINE